MESETVEFKQQFPEKAIEVAKELITFANAEGGRIYFGVDDDGFIVGVEKPRRPTFKNLWRCQNQL